MFVRACVSLMLVMFTFGALAGDAAPMVDKSLKDDSQRIWVSVDYFGMFADDSPRPGFPLFASDTGGTAALDSPTTVILYDDEEKGYGMQHGFQMAVGGWLTKDRKWGAELAGFYQPEVSAEDAVRSLPTTESLSHITAVPFFDTFNNREAAIILMVDFPNEAGGIKVSSEQTLWGVEASGLRNILRRDDYSLNARFGFRHFNLSENFTATYDRLNAEGWWNQYDVSQFYDPAVGADTFVDQSDYFMVDHVEARNRFYGANLGVDFELKKGRFLLEVGARVALGVNDETVRIEGSATRVEPSGRTITNVGGIFAQRSNIGEHGQTSFAVLPEFKLKVGVEITKNIGFMVGYDFMYINEVVRAGNQLDRRVDPRQMGFTVYGTNAPVAGALGPRKRMEEHDFWAHGLTAGLKFRF